MKELLDELSRLPHLKPDAVAAILGRRPRFLYEDEYVTDYLLTGGVMHPFSRVFLRWLRKLDKGMMGLDPADHVTVPIGELKSGWKGLPAYLPPDPRKPDGKHAYVYRVPVGELHLRFRDFEEEYVLHSIGLTEDLLLRWKE